MEPLALAQPALTSRPPGKGCFGTYPVLPHGKQLQVKLEYISDCNRQLLLQSSEFETHNSTGREPAQAPAQSHALFSSRCLQKAFSWGTSRWQAINQPTLRVRQERKFSVRPCSEQAMGDRGFSWKDFGQSIFWVSHLGCHSHREPHCQLPRFQITAGLCDQ